MVQTKKGEKLDEKMAREGIFSKRTYAQVSGKGSIDILPKKAAATVHDESMEIVDS